MSAVKEVAKVLKVRFGSLSTEETIDLAEKLIEAARQGSTTVLDLDKQPDKLDAFLAGVSEHIRKAVDESRCGHNRLHVFCGQCSPMSAL